MPPKRKFWTTERTFRNVFSTHFYASQTKILDGLTKRSMSRFESIFNESSPKSSAHTIEKCFEKTHRTFRSAIENPRLGGITFQNKHRPWPTQSGVAISRKCCFPNENQAVLKSSCQAVLKGRLLCVGSSLRYSHADIIDATSVEISR